MPSSIARVNAPNPNSRNHVRLLSQIAKFNRLADEMRYETRTKKDYSQVSLHLRRINRMLNVIFNDLPNDSIRYDNKLNSGLTKLADKFNTIIRRINNQNSFEDTNLTTIDYSTATINSITDYELIFIYLTVNRIIHETNLLVSELEKISLI